MTANNKIVREITPFLILGTFFTVVSVYMLINDGDSWGGIIAFFGFLSSAILIIADTILKKATEKYHQIFITEIVIIVLVVIWHETTFG